MEILTMSSHRCIKDLSILVIMNLMAVLWVRGVGGNVIVKDSNRTHTIAEFPDMEASFGPDFPVNGLEGLLMYASPDHEACSPVDPPPKNETRQKWILLIARSVNCEFADKVLNAQRHGYKAAIVHNYYGDNDVIAMGGGNNGSRVKIPSTFVGWQSGMVLQQYVSNATQQDYVIEIIEDEEDLRLYLWPFAVVVGVCFLVFLVFLLVKFLRDRATQRLNRLSRKHLKKIPVRKFKKGDYYDTCAICLDEYEEGEKIRVLPCDHVYHMKCIDPWLTKNKKTCPVCKRRVIPNDAESGSEAEDGQPAAGGSENTPLLGRDSRQSHGSMSESGATNNALDTARQNHIQFDRDDPSCEGENNTSHSDTEHGAVGGEGISNRDHQHQTALIQAVQTQNNMQDADTVRESKRRNQARLEEEEEAADTLLVPKSRSERRERKKQRKSKSKKSENRRRSQDGEGTLQVTGAQDNEALRNMSQGPDLSFGATAKEKADDAQMRITGEGGHEAYVNQSYSDDGEVVVPGTAKKCEMNEVV